MEDKLVNVQILYNDNSTHYHAPFILKVENTSKENLDLVLDNGSVIISDDSGRQDFIVTKEILLAIKIKETVEYEIYAMCLEQRKSAPNISTKYKVGDLANVNLRKLSAFIEEKESFEPEAQFLMWNIAEGCYLEDEIDEFEIDSNGSVWVVDLVNGERNVLNRTDEEEPISKSKLIVNGSFSMNFANSENVHIAMFNDQNVIVKELFKNAKCPAGLSQLKYEFNSYDYPEEEHFVKLVVGGKVRLTRKIEMKF